MKPIHIHPVQQRFLELRRRILKEALEKKKAELIRQGVPAKSLEIPRSEKKSEE